MKIVNFVSLAASLALVSPQVLASEQDDTELGYEITNNGGPDVSVISRAASQAVAHELHRGTLALYQSRIDGFEGQRTVCTRYTSAEAKNRVEVKLKRAAENLGNDQVGLNVKACEASNTQAFSGNLRCIEGYWHYCVGDVCANQRERC